MNKSTIISIVVASVFTGSALISWASKPSTKKFERQNTSVLRNVILTQAVAKSIRQTAQRNSRSNTGGGSSYGK